MLMQLGSVPHHLNRNRRISKMAFRDDDQWGEPVWRRALRAPAKWLKRLAPDDRIGYEKSFPMLAWDIVSYPLRLLAAFLVFMVVSWSTTRVGKRFVFGFPALIVAAGFCGAIWVDQYLGEERAISYSRSRGAAHLENDPNQPWLAEAFANKAVNLVPEDYDQARFELAKAYYASGKTEMAVDLVQRLSPLEPRSETDKFVDGHIWLADFYQSKVSANLPDELRRSKAREHYEQVDDTVLAKVGLAAILSAEGDLKSATEQLNQVLRTPFDYDDPRSVYAQISSYPILVDLYNRQDDKPRAAQVCRNGVGVMSRMVIEYPDYLPLWISISHCCVLTEDFDRALEVLIDGERKAQRNETKLKIRQLAAEVLVVKAKSVESLENQASLKFHLVALAKALRTDIRNVEAYRALAKFIDKKKLSSEQAIWVNELVLERGIKGIMHVLVGMQQIVAGQTEPGKNHWEIARQQYTFAPNVIYNLIEVAVKNDEQLDQRKFELVAVAMELFPNQPALKLTRGTFSLKDKEYEAALTDFELVLADEAFSNVLANRRRVIEGMIECYVGLGNEEKVAEYQQRLEGINDLLARQQKVIEESLEKESDEDSE